MRALRSLASCAVALVALASCSQSDNGGVVGAGPGRSGPVGPPGALHARLPAAVADAGVLRVGASIGRAPLLFYGTGTKQLEGLEYELVQAIGRQLGVTMVITDEAFAQLGPDLGAKRIDLLISGFVDIKAFERAGIDFVDYLNGRSAVLVRHGSPAHVHGPDDLCGHSVGVLGGTAQQVAVGHLDEGCRRRGRPAIATSIGADHGALLRTLQAGQLDGVLDDALVAQYNAQGSTGAGTLDVVGAAVDPLPYGIGVNKDALMLRDAIQAALRNIIADGSYDAALNHWGGAEAALRSATVNAGP
ncbi:MAG: ABC transporter substrate-binding protein [Acidimicrobiales bacterium]